MYVCICVCYVCAYMYGYFPDAAVSRRLHANGTKAYRWGMHPKPGKSVPVTCMRRMHMITYERTLVCPNGVYVIARASVERGCVRPYVQQSVLCHTVYRGQ